ncbi:hypothetical protein BDK51DRAFT_28071, partial [Blyttiomyces helicus]
MFAELLHLREGATDRRTQTRLVERTTHTLRLDFHGVGSLESGQLRRHLGGSHPLSLGMARTVYAEMKDCQNREKKDHEGEGEEEGESKEQEDRREMRPLLPSVDSIRKGVSACQVWGSGQQGVGGEAKECGERNRIVLASPLYLVSWLKTRKRVGRSAAMGWVKVEVARVLFPLSHLLLSCLLPLPLFSLGQAGLLLPLLPDVRQQKKRGSGLRIFQDTSPTEDRTPAKNWKYDQRQPRTIHALLLQQYA